MGDPWWGTQVLAAIASFIFIQSVSAQSTVSTVIDDVPAHVSTAFSGKFAEGDVKKWEKRNEGYVAHFNGTLLSSNKVDAYKEDHVLYYTREGELVRTEKI